MPAEELQKKGEGRNLWLLSASLIIFYAALFFAGDPAGQFLAVFMVSFIPAVVLHEVAHAVTARIPVIFGIWIDSPCFPTLRSRRSIS